MKKTIYKLMMICMLILSGCTTENNNNSNTIYVFSQPGCGHCIDAHNYFTTYYKNYDIQELNVREANNYSKMMNYAKKFKIPQNSLGTPFIVFQDEYIMGWGNEQIKKFNKLIKNTTEKTTK